MDTLSGGVDLQTVMVNALYDFSLAEDAMVVPYIGAGVGLASVEFDRISSGFLNFTGDDDVLAYQGTVGLAFPVTDSLDLSLDARYLRTDKVEFDIGPGALLQDEEPIKGLSVMAGLRWNF